MICDLPELLLPSPSPRLIILYTPRLLNTQRITQVSKLCTRPGRQEFSMRQGNRKSKCYVTTWVAMVSEKNIAVSRLLKTLVAVAEPTLSQDDLILMTSSKILVPSEVMF